MKYRLHWNSIPVQAAWKWYKKEYNYNLLIDTREKIADHWYELFGCVDANYSFPGYLEFDNEQDYMLFVLRWS